MGTCSFWHKWILVVWLIIGNGRSGDVKVASRRKRPGCHLCRLWVKKRARSKPPLTPECSISPEKILLRPKCWYQTIFGSLSVGDTITAVSSSISASGNLNSLRFVANVGKCKRDFYPNGKDRLFCNMTFLAGKSKSKSCLYQKYEITPFKRVKNEQELEKLAFATSRTLLFPIQLNWLENIKDLTDKYLIFQLIWSLKARDLHRLPPSLFKHSQPICLPSVLANRKERIHSWYNRFIICSITFPTNFQKDL